MIAAWAVATMPDVRRTLAKNVVSIIITLSFAALLSALPDPRAFGQPTTPAAPAAGAPAAPDKLAMAIQRREEWRRSRMAIYMNDFGELARYRQANARLKPPAAGESRVVFFGDSITDMWRLEQYFPGKPYVNRGISGQTTAQMLVRFRQDVIDLQPKAVVILAGTNDIAGNSGPMTREEIQANFTTLAELAHRHGIRIIFCSILPVHNYTAQSDPMFPLRPPEKIAELNRWLKTAAAAGGGVYLDYFGAMVDGKGWLRRELAEDGLHPNKAGYEIMAGLARAAIEKALAPKPSGG